ncbi:hypothetical protein BKA69DRAFT_1058994 [Paraphysoderma sedebokerense]|nr:hypothetical protein BKA69DRAFT_1058994 [Paraphysoderma sedebokerense]
MSDDFIGRGTVSLSEVFAKGLHDSWFPIMSKSGKPAGEVRLVVCFKSKVSFFRNSR